MVISSEMLINCHLLTRLCCSYWVLGAAIYTLKFVSRKFDVATQYGKLRSTTMRFSVDHGVMFTSFYIVGLVWVCCLLFLGISCGSVAQQNARAVAFSVRRIWELVCACRAAGVEHAGRGFNTRTLVLGLYSFHLLRRTLECLFVHKFSKRQTPAYLAVVGTLPVQYCRSARMLTQSLCRLELLRRGWSDRVCCCCFCRTRTYLASCRHRCISCWKARFS